MGSKKQRNQQIRLTHHQYALLHQWGTQPANKEYLAGHEMIESAKAAAEALGFPISISSIQDLRQNLGITKPRPVKPDFATLELRIIALYRAQLDLYAALGIVGDPVADLNRAFMDVPKVERLSVVVRHKESGT